MSTKFETFSYTPVELAESMTSTVHDTLGYLNRNDYLSNEDYDELMNTLAVYAMPNRKGFGQRLRERFFGKDENESAFVFPIVEVDPTLFGTNSPKNKKRQPTLNVVKGDFTKEKTDE